MRAAVLFVVLAACGAGSVGDDDSTGDDDSSGTNDAHQECVDYTNMYRVANGKDPVARSAELEAFADEGAEYDYSRNPHDHFISTNGGGIAFAENECPHWDLSFGGGDLLQLVDACIDAYYSEGPGGGHYENMMGPYGSLGCGIYQNGTDYTILQDYGN